MASVPAVSPWPADRRPAPSICVVSQGREAHGARAVRHPLAGAGPARPCEARGFWVGRRVRRYRRGPLTGAALGRFAWSHRAARLTAPERFATRRPARPCETRGFWVRRRVRRYRRGPLTGAALGRFAWSHRAARLTAPERFATRWPAPGRGGPVRPAASRAGPGSRRIPAPPATGPPPSLWRAAPGRPRAGPARR